jgi:hypothetical protein
MPPFLAKNDQIVFSEGMPVGLRILLIAAGFVPFLAPYDLLIRPGWTRFSLPLVFAIVISLGAVAVGLLLIFSALFGLNQVLHFDGSTRTILYTYETPLIPIRRFRYQFGDMAEMKVNVHEWSDAPSTYGVQMIYRDGRKTEVGSFAKELEATAALQKVRQLIGWGCCDGFHSEEAEMRKKDALTKILAIAGTTLVWLPVVAMVFITAAVLVRHGGFHFDYLIPAELFPVFFGGGLLLLWGFIRAKRYRMWIGVGLGAALVFLVAGQAVAVATGLAKGATQPGGWQAAVVLGAIILYDLAVIAVGVGGILLTKDLFRKQTLSDWIFMMVNQDGFIGSVVPDNEENGWKWINIFSLVY